MVPNLGAAHAGRNGFSRPRRSAKTGGGHGPGRTILTPMPSFADFDTRHYRTVDVVTGYDGWSATYEDSVPDAMDLDLLEGLACPDWSGLARAADLGCGTGRTGSWLRGRGVGRIDGVDLSSGMLALAHERGAHDSLTRADVRETGLATAAYDLVIASLIDEHLPDLAPFYAEARRLARPGGTCVLVAYHPQFSMVSGMPTHYTDASGEDIAIATHVHLVSDHVRAARACGWTLVEMSEATVDDGWLAAKPKWKRFRGHPISAAFVWTAPA